MGTNNMRAELPYSQLLSDLVVDYNLKCWYWKIKNDIDLYVNMNYYKNHNLYFPIYVLDKHTKFIFTSYNTRGAVTIGRSATAVGHNAIAIGCNSTVTNNAITIGL